MNKQTETLTAQEHHLPGFMKLVGQELKRWEESRKLGMRLHEKSIAEFSKMSVDEKRQALLEWWLDSRPSCPLPAEGVKHVWPFPK
jgi:hypothetical protein